MPPSPAGLVADAPVFHEILGPEMHDSACRLFSTGLERVVTVKAREEIDGGDLTFKTWREQIGSLKSSAQWKTKLGTLSGKDIQANNKEDIGNMVWCHLSEAGWSANPLQEKPKA